MATPIFGWFDGVVQGKIEGWGSWPGEDDIKDREGSSLIYQLEHEITIPRNPQTGLPAGQRVHHPVRVIKRIDKASPKLFQALCQAERFKTVTFKWYRTKAGSGKQEHYFTTELQDAILVGMKDWFPITVDQDKESYSHFEDLALTYRRIRWVWEIDGIEAIDDWQEH
jgi:type VI secretion system secreted protein Hcp